jgi:UrcA family protein
MQKIALIAAIAVAAFSATTPVVAAPASGAWKVGNDSYHLYLTDLDLHAAAGRAEALARVEKIAEKLCGRAGLRAEQRDCIAATVQRSVHGSAAQAIQMAQTERSATILVAARK